MEVSNVCFWSIMLYEFKKGVNMMTSFRNICEVFQSEVVSLRTCQNWYTKFRSGDFELKDKQHSGRPSAIDDDILKEMVKENPWQMTRDLAAKLGVDHTTVFHHLKNFNMVCKLNVWVPHKLNEKNLLDRYSGCFLLLSHHACEPFLDRIVIGDEKWIVYDNVIRKRHWSPKGETSLTVAKPDLHQNKVICCVVVGGIVKALFTLNF